jgi:hypothetical protein
MVTDKERQSLEFTIGQIHAHTECLPDMRRDISLLKKKVAVVEIKSGLWGTLGGFMAMAWLFLRDNLIPK